MTSDTLTTMYDVKKVYQAMTMAENVAYRMAVDIDHQQSRSRHVSDVWMMLSRCSVPQADALGLRWDAARIDESAAILKQGPAARWWLSERLLLGLTHDEAVTMGGWLRKWL